MLRRKEEEGLKDVDLAAIYKISRQRVGQILKRDPRKPLVAEVFYEGMPKWKREGRELAREKVRRRDGYRCTSCKRPWKVGTRSFDVHHLHGVCGQKSRGYDSVNDMDGLITLCHKCHMSKHVDRKKFGKGPILAPHKDEIARLREQGVSYEVLGKKYRVSGTAVYMFHTGWKAKLKARKAAQTLH